MGRHRKRKPKQLPTTQPVPTLVIPVKQAATLIDWTRAQAAK